MLDTALSGSLWKMSDCEIKYVGLWKCFDRDYLAGLATQYDEIIDVRTPLEFEEVLNNLRFECEHLYSNQ